jgi:hypothetical protein
MLKLDKTNDGTAIDGWGEGAESIHGRWSRDGLAIILAI